MGKLNWKDVGLVALAAGAIGAAVCAYRAQQHVHTLEDNIALQRRAAAEERTGRANAEHLLQQQIHEEEKQQQEKQREQKQDVYNFQPIGTVRSCFPNRCGTPRQGLLVSFAKGCIHLNRLIPPESLENLSSYSHVWIVFIFHENTNVATGKGLDQRQTFPAKVRPPQLLGGRVGLFSTRTPHRPNPIGLSLVKLDQVDTLNRLVYISGLDLVDGTPVLDIKPYIPVYDSQPTATYPDWIESTAHTARSVNISQAALESFELVKQHLQFYPDPQEYLDVVKELLPLDIRSVRQGRGSATGSSSVYRVQLDALLVEFITLDEDIEVVKFGLPPPKDHVASQDDEDATSAVASRPQQRSSGRAVKSAAASAAVDAASS